MPVKILWSFHQYYELIILIIQMSVVGTRPVLFSAEDVHACFFWSFILEHPFLNIVEL